MFVVAENLYDQCLCIKNLMLCERNVMCDNAYGYYYRRIRVYTHDYLKGFNRQNQSSVYYNFTALRNFLPH